MSVRQKFADLITGGAYTKFRHDAIELEDVINKARRPSLDQLFHGGRMIPITDSGEQRPIGYPEMYRLVDKNYVLDQVIAERAKQAFRKADDIEFVKRFEHKCDDCGSEYRDKKVKECEACGSTNMSEPDHTQLTMEVMDGRNIRQFMHRCNYNKQKFLDVVKVAHMDTDITDSGIIIMPKDYILDEDGAIVGSVPKEVVRGDPNIIWPVSDKFGIPGGKYWVCLVDECDTILIEMDREVGYQLRCAKHNTILHEAHFVSMEEGVPKVFYIEGEIYNWQLHVPGILWGRTPLIGLDKVLRALIKMVEHVWITYEHSRPPKGALIIPSVNPNSVQKFWEKQMEQAKQEKNYFPIIAVDGERSKPVFIPFSGTMEELQYLQTLEEFRRAISARYGVSLIFQSDSSTGGGLNNDSMQITVTNRAIDEIHATLHSKPFRWVLDEFGVIDWELKLPENEEKDEAAEIQRDGMRMDNAQKMLGLGYVPQVDENGEWSFEFDPEEAQKIKNPAPPGLGGMGGLEPPPSGDLKGPASDDEGMPAKPSAPPSIKDLLNLSKSQIDEYEAYKASRTNKDKPIEISLPENLQKECGAGKHRHSDRDYCHPEGRKHDVAAKPEDGGGEPKIIMETPTSRVAMDQAIAFNTLSMPDDSIAAMKPLVSNSMDMVADIIGDVSIHVLPYGMDDANAFIMTGTAGKIFIPTVNKDDNDFILRKRHCNNFLDTKEGTGLIESERKAIDFWRERTKDLGPEEAMAATLLHEKGHLITLQKIKYMGESNKSGEFIEMMKDYIESTSSLKEQYGNYKNATGYKYDFDVKDYVEDPEANIVYESEKESALRSFAYYLGEAVADDYLILNSGKLKGYPLNKSTYRDDTFDLGIMEKRLGILRDVMGW